MAVRRPAVSHPTPTRRDHLRFCEIERWHRVRSAVGKDSTHHQTYELELDSGEILRTRISRPPDRTDYGAGLWSHILREQLQGSADEFWKCVQLGTPPDRGAPAAPPGAIPTELLYALKHSVGLTEEQLAKMSRQEAIERMQQYWTTGE